MDFAQLTVGDLQLVLVHLADLSILPMWSFQDINPRLYDDPTVSPVFVGVTSSENLSRGVLRDHVIKRNSLRLPSIRSVTLLQLHLIRGHESVQLLLDGLKSGRIMGFRVTDIRSARDFHCDSCLRGRAVRLSLKKASRTRAVHPLFRLFLIL